MAYFFMTIICQETSELVDITTGNVYVNIKGPSRDFSGRGICHFLRRNIGKLGFEIAGNGIRYTHGTGNVLIFLLGKREKYEMIA